MPRWVYLNVLAKHSVVCTTKRGMHYNVQMPETTEYARYITGINIVWIYISTRDYKFIAKSNHFGQQDRKR